MSTILTQDDLVNIKHTVLTLERQEIARNIDPKRFFGHLRAKYVFDERDCDEIRAVSSRVGSAEVFVDTLKRKGGRGYDEFCNALMNDKTQLFLLQRLTQTLELLRAKVIERKTEKSIKNEQQRSLSLSLAQQAPLPSQQPPSVAHQRSLPQPASLPQQVPSGRRFSYNPVPAQQTHPLQFQQFQQNLYSSSLPMNVTPGNLKNFQQQPASLWQPNSSLPVTAGRNSLPVNSSLTGQLPPHSESHNPQAFVPLHKPFRKIQSRQTEKQEESTNVPPPAHYPPAALMNNPSIYSGEAPQGQDVYVPSMNSHAVVQQPHPHFTIQPQQFNSPHQIGVVPQPYYNNEDQIGTAMVNRSYYRGEYMHDSPQEQITYSGNNPAVLPGMFARGISEGFPPDGSQIGYSRNIGEVDLDHRTCGQVILARGSDS